ncbi:hypothetical protein I4U23_008616 [Adineta vaga]|nr:hypothetical protein I4U23_008616 [Adineta vaga]
MKTQSNSALTKRSTTEKTSNWLFNDLQQYSIISKTSSINMHCKSDDNVVLLSTKDHISKINTCQSTNNSDCLFSRSKVRSNKDHSLADVKHFCQNYLQNGNHETSIDSLHELVQKIDIVQYKKQYLSSPMNNNHFHLSPTCNSNLQLSNNKEKKKKKDTAEEKENNEYTNNSTDSEIIMKKRKKNKEKSKKIEEITTDSETGTDPRMSTNPLHTYHHNSKSPTDTIGHSSVSIPIPNSSGLSTKEFLVADPIHIPVSQPSLPLTSISSVQHQLQALSEMARDSDEILITLNINGLTQKQPNSTQNYPNFQQPQNESMSNNFEIVAKGFIRAHIESPMPRIPLYNQPTSTKSHPLFVPQHPIPFISNVCPPSKPIAPPIQPILSPPIKTMMYNGVALPPNSDGSFISDIRNNSDNTHHRCHINFGKCDHLCQSSLYQPDFRGRPSPGVMINPYFSNASYTNKFSTKRSTKHQSKTKPNNQQQSQYCTFNFENINRTYSSIY